MSSEREHVVLVEGEKYQGDEWVDMPFSSAVQINPAESLERGKTYPFIDMAAISSDSQRVHASQERKYSGGGARFRAGDTLMARITPCLENGKIARYYTHDASEYAHGSTEFIVIRGRDRVTDTGFSYYLTRWEEVHKYAISQMTGTSGRQRVPVESLDHLIVRVPPLSEQRAIAGVLGVLDERIEVNRRMNQTLEAMAQALFQDWFIDFGPTRAKTAGHKPYLPKPLWNLFPNKLTNSKLGKIPEGWESWRLDEIAEHRKEGVDPSKEPEAVFEHYSIPAYDTGCHPAMDEGASIKSNKSRIPQCAVLLSKLNPDISRVWVPDDPGDAVQVASTEFLAYVPREGFGRGLLSALFRSLPFREVLQGMVTGTSKSHQRVPPKALNAVECLVGTPEHFSAFESFTGAALRRQMRNRREIRTLTALRDTLLPNLVSGKIRIRNTKHQTENAA